MMNRRQFLQTGTAALSSAGIAQPVQGAYQVGAYYFPNYHVDPRNEALHGPGWTEWEILKKATPRFPGHQQPKVPLWGYENEADPRVMEKKIAAAADHAIDYWIFDWYHYDDGPFLNRCLDEGFLQASNNGRLRFCLMWANHDWVNLFPAPYKLKRELIRPGRVTRESWERITDLVVSKYFSHPSHWNIEGAPYFSIYELMTLMDGLGGAAATADALASFRRKTKAAGFPDLHLNAVVWGVQILPNEKAIKDPNELLAKLGFNSITSYVWIHHVRLPHFPTTEYSFVREQAIRHWRKTSTEMRLPYYPNVSMGWDSTPRTVQSNIYAQGDYPYMPVIRGNTPPEFRKSLEEAKRFLDSQANGPRILNINSWNEWTEGSYLEPDRINRMGYLEAVRDVFGKS